jgi:MFS family permease
VTHNPRSLAPFLAICLVGFGTLFSSYLRLPIMPLYAASLGAGPAAVGMINGAFMLSAGLLSIPAGLLADRIGRKLPIVFGVLATALSSLLVTQCRQPGEMVAVYALFGVGLAAFTPAMLSLVADITPGERLGQAYGWYTTAVYIAMTVGPATGGLLAGHLGLRAVFFVSAALLLGMALLAALLLPTGGSRHHSDLQGVLAASALLLRERGFLACLVATVGSCVGFGAFLTFLPLHAASAGHDPTRVGLVFAAQALTNVVVRIPLGRIADRVDRRLLVAAGLLCLGLALPALGLATGLAALLGCTILLGVGMALTYTAIGALIAEQTPPLLRGLAMGMYNSCFFLGMMVGSTVLGLALKQIGYPLGFALAGGVALAALVGFWRLMRGDRT